MNNYTSDGRNLRAEIEPYLNPGENILWVGQPNSARASRLNPMLVIFLTFWLGFAVFWTVTASAAGGAFGLFGIPFVLIGVGMFYGMTVGQKKQYSSAVYAVTDRRAIILYTDRHGVNCTAYVFSNLQTVTMERVQGTVGTIRFRSNVTYDYADYGYGRRRRTTYGGDDVRNTFAAIEDVQGVYRLISEQIAACK